MTRYIPLDVGLSIHATSSDVYSFSWRPDQSIEAVFYSDDLRRLLKVNFDGPCIVRLIGAFPLGTEHEDRPDEGFVNEHFAYRVVGATFDRSQSKPWKTAVSLKIGPTRHYRFITGNTCIDVVTPAKPVFTAIAVETNL